MNKALTDNQNAQNLPWAITNMALNAASAQLTYSGPLFMLLMAQVGFGRTLIGVVLAIFHLANLAALIIAPALSRYGYKRSYIGASLGRQIVYLVVLASLVFAPQTALFIVPLVVLLYAILRSIAETSFNAWLQQFVPGAYVNRFSIIASISSGVLSIVALGAAAFFLTNDNNVMQYGALGIAGVGIGLIAVYMARNIAGGAAVESPVNRPARSELLQTLRQRRFIVLLVGTTFINLALAALAFVPLLLREHTQLPSGAIVVVAGAIMLGGLASNLLWTRIAERWGTRPVIISSLVLFILVPLAWVILPTGSLVTVPLAIVIALLSGIMSAGWNLGSLRLMIVNIAPQGKQTQFLSVHYALNAIVSGVGLVLAGFALDNLTTNEALFAGIKPDTYVPVFAISSILAIVGVFVFSSLTSTPKAGSRSILARLNPLSLLAKLGKQRTDGNDANGMTDGFTAPRNRASVDEVLDALTDPSFSKRREAINAAPRMPKDDRLFHALIDALNSNEPELSSSAMWALGQYGDKRAIQPLREFLTSPHSLLRASSARSLASLGDYDIAPLLLQTFKNETDDGLRLAYASALGKLRIRDVLPDVLEMLRTLRGRDPRMELALAVTRIAETQDHFARMVREWRQKGNAVCANELTAIQRSDRLVGLSALQTHLITCAQMINQPNIEPALPELVKLLNEFETLATNPLISNILRECSLRIPEFGSDRMEYILLGINALDAAVK